MEAFLIFLTCLGYTYVQMSAEAHLRNMETKEQKEKPQEKEREKDSASANNKNKRAQSSKKQKGMSLVEYYYIIIKKN